jgi:hypothetical protein
MEKCVFCKQTGHRINQCIDPNMNSTIEMLESKIYQLKYRRELLVFFMGISFVQVQVLAKHAAMKTYLTKGILADYLADHYYRKIRIREINQLFNTAIFPDATVYLDFSDPDVETHLLREMLSSSLIGGYRSIRLILIDLELFVSIGYMRFPEYVDLVERPMAVVRDYCERYPLFKWAKIIRCSPDELESTECPICMDSKPGNESVRLNCRHTMCVSCSSLYLKDRDTEPTCPLCRSVIDVLYIPNANCIFMDFVKHPYSMDNIN